MKVRPRRLLCRDARYLILTALSVIAVGAQSPPEFVARRLLIKFKGGIGSERAQAVLQSLQTRSTGQIPGLGIHIVELPEQASEVAFQRAFAERAEVEFAELDGIRPHAITPNDPSFSSEWHLTRIDAPNAWPVSTGTGVVVAVADTGVDSTHPDLSPRIVPGWNVVDNNSNTADVYGHGTKVAGTIAAASNNGIGVASIAWDARIMPVRISLPNGSAYDSAIANGIVWAADHGARVVNVSYYVTGGSSISSAAQYLYQRGGIVTASAGNYATVETYPDDPYILTVGGTDPSDVLYSWSNSGPIVDLVAPGCVTTTFNGGGYGGACGTSFSSPITAAVAALVMAARPGITSADLVNLLKSSADDLGSAGRDSTFGWGRVNAARAVASSTPSDSQSPTVTFTSPTNGAVLSGTAAIQVSASDNVGVTSVVVTANGVNIGSRTSTPYTFSWNTTAVANGAYTLTATARDAAGNSAVTTISVSVNNVVADTQAPSVTITSPSPGAVLTGAVAIQVSATDNIGVASVNVAANGTVIGSWTAAPYFFTWSTTNTPNGAYTLTATARDSAGNSKSVGISVTVNNPPPSGQSTSVHLTSPSAGAILKGSSVNFGINWSGTLARVEYYCDGVLVARSASAPYSATWKMGGLPRGVHQFQAKGYDATGNPALSGIVSASR